MLIQRPMSIYTGSLIALLSVTFLAGCPGASSQPAGAPTVISTIPMDGATDVAINTKIVASFSEEMDPTTLTAATFTVVQGDTPVSGAVAHAGANATFTPTNNLAMNSNFTAMVTTGATDLDGNALAADFVWDFTTGESSEMTAPMVVSTIPTDGATGVVIDQTISATFDEPMDPTTITTFTFLVTGPGVTPVAGTVAFDVATDTASFTPTSNLETLTTFTAAVTTGAEDSAGNGLADDFVWTFTTGNQEAEAPVFLNSANAFAVLGGSTVTNSGPTILTGNLGVSPGSAITGFPPGSVIGTTHAADATAAQAKLDLTAAYLDLAARSNAPIVIAGNLGGLTLTPGLYKSTSSLEISSGDLTLDAQGDMDGVFVIQMASTLTTTPDRQIFLTGGAKAANVYWQVGSSATLGTDSVFKGNILALESISLGTGATIEGRALAQDGAITLLSNIVTIPAP